MASPYYQEAIPLPLGEVTIADEQQAERLEATLPMLLDLRDNGQVMRGPDSSRPLTAVHEGEATPTVTIRAEQEMGRMDGEATGVWSVLRSGLPRVQIELGRGDEQGYHFGMFEAVPSSDGDEELRIAAEDVRQDVTGILHTAAMHHAEQKAEAQPQKQNRGARLLRRLGLRRPK